MGIEKFAPTARIINDYAGIRYFLPGWCGSIFTYFSLFGGGGLKLMMRLFRARARVVLTLLAVGAGTIAVSQLLRQKSKAQQRTITNADDAITATATSLAVKASEHDSG